MRLACPVIPQQHEQWKSHCVAVYQLLIHSIRCMPVVDTINIETFRHNLALFGVSESTGDILK